MALGQELLELVVGEVDVVDGLAAVLERGVVAVDVGREKDFWIS